MNNTLNYDFKRAWGDAVATGVIRQLPEDFRVTETLTFSPSGGGDHVYLFIEKTGANTEWVVSQLMALTELKSVDIGYAGLKDRHAITQQWFSLHMPNQAEPDWNLLPNNIQILIKTRHEKKLKTGAIQQNSFKLTVRDLVAEESELNSRLAKIQSHGVPNYFGEQRFGRNFGNVQRFISSKGNRKRIKRQERSLLISSARSYLFNHILSKRISLGNWNQIIEGEVLMIDGSRSIFIPDEIDDVLQSRLEALDIHPCAILWGKGREMVTGLAAALADEVVSENPQITDALTNIGVSLAHRGMRLSVNELDWEIEQDELTLSFSLVSGAYATSVLSEFLKISE